MPGFLKDKTAIKDYTGLGDKALDDCISSLRFPHFRVGRNLCSHEEAIDEWAVEMARRGMRIDPEQGLEETPQPRHA